MANRAINTSLGLVSDANKRADKYENLYNRTKAALEAADAREKQLTADVATERETTTKLKGDLLKLAKEAVVSEAKLITEFNAQANAALEFASTALPLISRAFLENNVGIVQNAIVLDILKVKVSNAVVPVSARVRAFDKNDKNADGNKYAVEITLDGSGYDFPEQNYPRGGRKVKDLTEVVACLTNIVSSAPSYFTTTKIEEELKKRKEADEKLNSEIKTLADKMAKHFESLFGEGTKVTAYTSFKDMMNGEDKCFGCGVDLKTDQAATAATAATAAAATNSTSSSTSSASDDKGKIPEKNA